MVYYGDCPLIPAALLESLVDRQKRSGAAKTLITAELEDPAGYGRVMRDAAGRVAAIVEQKAGSPEQLAVREINVGIYCFRADLFWKHVDELQPNNPAREYYLTDMVEILLRSGYRVDALRAPDPTELLGINNRIELAAADRRNQRDVTVGHNCSSAAGHNSSAAGAGDASRHQTVMFGSS